MSEFVHPLSDPFSSPRRLSQLVVQAATMLGLVRAEAGRILGFKCAEFTALFEGRSVLQEGSYGWRQGVLFVRLYQALYERMAGDEAKMNNWLRRHHQSLGSSPFYLIVDEGRLSEVVRWLEAGDD